MSAVRLYLLHRRTFRPGA